MKIFFLAQRLPYPPNRGDKITTFHEIRHLSKSHDIEVFCLSEGAADQENLRALRQIVPAVHAVDLNHTSARLRILSALPSDKALSVAYYDEKRLRDIIKERFAIERPDLIFVYSSNMAQYAEDLPSTYKIMQFGDIDSFKWQQYSKRKTIPARWLYALEARRLLNHERKIARSFSHSIVYTEAERRDFMDSICPDNVSIVQNGVDSQYFSPGETEKVQDSIIFTGVMDYYPNVDAMKWFCEDILPRVRKKIEKVSLTVCGARPNQDVLGLASDPAVTVTGSVPETLPFLRRAGVAVAPLRMGRGVQNKVLEAMAVGLPCVVTSTAFTGIAAVPGRDLLVADGPEDFAQKVIALLEDDQMRRDMAANARKAVEGTYSWIAQLSQLDRVIASVTGVEP